jgi:spore coat protein CotH
MDSSLLRDKVAGDVFRAAGVPSPWRAFYRVFIDVGDGPTYFGLYTVAEVPDGPMFDRELGGDGGNLYKPDMVPGAWTPEGPVDDAAFPKKANEDEADWSDIEDTIAALHADSSDSAAWLEELDRHLHVGGFLRWLAVNTSIQDWDTYGNMGHNYYLYGDPSAGGQLTWIPWDHNMAFADDVGLAPPLPLDMEGVGDEWPLIRRLMDDDTCRGRYFDFVEEFAAGAFERGAMSARFQSEHDLIAEYVVGDEGERPGYTSLASDDAFLSSVGALEAHVAKRQRAIVEELQTR